MNEREVIDIIVAEFRALRLEPPEGILRDMRSRASPRLDRVMIAWTRAARRIAAECDSDNRRAARTASIIGASITRGRTKL